MSKVVSFNFTEEEVRKYYIEENHSKAELNKHFGTTDWSMSKFLREHKIVKPKGLSGEIRAATKKERYGDSTYNARDKFKKTCIERYGGVGFGSAEIREKYEEVVFQKFGTRDIRKSEYFKEKSAETKKQRYGDSNYNNKEKGKQTCLNRYGVDNPSKSSEIRKKTVETTTERYGVPYACMRPEARKYSSDSKPNKAFAAFLAENGVEFEREFPIGNRSFDFKVGNLLIEINPAVTHNSTFGILGNSPMSSKYHQDKLLLAREGGFRCIHVWDWDDREKLLSMLKPRKPLYARKLELKEIEQKEANTFLKEYHLQGRSQGQVRCLALYRDSELIEVMTFGKPRFNKNYQWELIRLCTKDGWFVVGGAERLFRRFLELENPESIISYCDNSKFSGEVYTRIGFNLKTFGKPSKHWFNLNTGDHVTDNGLRMKGFDKLFGEQFGSFGKGTSNDELMRLHGFVEIYDAGQSVYVWNP